MANFPWLPKRLFEQEDRACIFDFHPSLFIGPLIERSGKVPFDFLFDLAGVGEHSEIMCTSSSWRCKNMNSRISATCEKPSNPQVYKMWMHHGWSMAFSASPFYNISWFNSGVYVTAHSVAGDASSLFNLITVTVKSRLSQPTIQVNTQRLLQNYVMWTQLGFNMKLLKLQILKNANLFTKGGHSIAVCWSDHLKQDCVVLVQLVLPHPPYCWLTTTGPDLPCQWEARVKFVK